VEVGVGVQVCMVHELWRYVLWMVMAWRFIGRRWQGRVVTQRVGPLCIPCTGSTDSGSQLYSKHVLSS
jgi:hypothetical protein